MAGRADPKTWRCRRCLTVHTNTRLRKCPACGKARKRRVSKHKQLLEAARPLYGELLEIQGGRCAICLREPTEGRRLDLDHDHKTMRIRGLLCHKCNRALPSWITVPWLQAATEYLSAPPTILLGGVRVSGTEGKP